MRLKCRQNLKVMLCPNPCFSSLINFAITLANRVVMAPLTRNRAAAGLVPSPFAAEYYAQRASAGLIIAEATQISARRRRAIRTRPASIPTNRSRAGAR